MNSTNVLRSLLSPKGLVPWAPRVRERPEPAIELISLHIPKAAGTSFRVVLEGVYGPAAVWCDYTGYIEDSGILHRRNPGQARRLAMEKLRAQARGLRVVHGHFPLDKYRLVRPQAKRITWLRHPLSRLVSHYYFWLTTDRHGNPAQDGPLNDKPGLLDFARLPVMRDFMLNNLLRGVDPVDLDFIGLQEYFKEDLAELAGLMAWGSYPAAIRHNTGRMPGYGRRLAQVASDQKLVAELLELNRGDMALYRWVAARRGRYAPDNPWLA